MSILDEEYRKKINELSSSNFLNDSYLQKSLEFKNTIDDFKLIFKINDSFINDVYKKSFSNILDFEFENNFHYTKIEIFDLEDELKQISEFNFSKYNRILDYMILKSTDLDLEFYGSIINFIYIMFDYIKRNFELIKKSKRIWEKKYKDIYPTFSDFKESDDFKIEILMFSSKDEFNFNKKFFNFDNISDVIEFLVFTSINSDFYLKKINDKNLYFELFNNDYDLYKKNGYNLLEDIKNKIIFYN